MLLLPAVVILVVTGFIAITRLHVLGRDAGLVVKAVRVTVDRPGGHCPTFQFNFTGRVSSNGAGGPITYQWIKPDGTTTNATSANLPSGEKEWIARLQFTFQGQGQATGDTVLRVISPTDIKSLPAHVTYQCP